MVDQQSKKPSGDETVPPFLLTTLLVGLPFAGVLAAFNRAGGPTGHLAIMELVLLVEGLTIAFFWRRMPKGTARTVGLVAFVVGIWAYMVACLLSAYGTLLAPHGGWAKYALALGGLVSAGPVLVFGSSWASRQKGAQRMQTLAMGFAALALALGFSFTNSGPLKMAAKAARTTAKMPPEVRHEHEEEEHNAAEHGGEPVHEHGEQAEPAEEPASHPSEDAEREEGHGAKPAAGHAVKGEAHQHGEAEREHYHVEHAKPAAHHAEHGEGGAKPDAAQHAEHGEDHAEGAKPAAAHHAEHGEDHAEGAKPAAAHHAEHGDDHHAEHGEDHAEGANPAAAHHAEHGEDHAEGAKPAAAHHAEHGEDHSANHAKAADEAEVATLTPEKHGARSAPALASADAEGAAPAAGSAPEEKAVKPVEPPSEQDEHHHVSPHSAAKPSSTSQWSYEGEAGPANWSSLNDDWSVCSSGREQSPIDIPRSSLTRNTIKLNYGKAKAKVLDNGHGIQVNIAPGHKATINQQVYELKQLHFHTPSEHQLSGATFPLEIQFVHQDRSGHTAVISAFVESGDVAKEIRKVIGTIPTRSGVELAIPALLDLAQILPRNLTSYQYRGSLTTPPCSEGVVWSVLQQPLTFSSVQIAELRTRYTQTNRPVRPLGDRRIGAVPTLAH